MKGIIDYLERTAGRFPDKTAVASVDVTYSFSELRDFSRRVGAEIGKHCAGAEPVAVLVDRSAHTVCAFLGAVYNGCYYIPVDPNMPEDKIRAVLIDSNAKVAVGSESDRTLLERIGFLGTFICYDQIGSDLADAPEISADTPLYMVYTSGSTGKPKGVLKSHQAVSSFIEAYARTFDLTESEIIGNQTPLFFDASAKDLYQMLYTGATLEIIPSEYFMLPTALIDY